MRYLLAMLIMTAVLLPGLVLLVVFVAIRFRPAASWRRIPKPAKAIPARENREMHKAELRALKRIIATFCGGFVASFVLIIFVPLAGAYRGAFAGAIGAVVGTFIGYAAATVILREE